MTFLRVFGFSTESSFELHRMGFEPFRKPQNGVRPIKRCRCIDFELTERLSGVCMPINGLGAGKEFKWKPGKT